MFKGVNESDARASVKTYSRLIAEKNRGLIPDPNPRVCAGVAELTSLLGSGTVNLISLPTQEFPELDEKLVTGPILVSVISGSVYEEYLVLVRADSGFKTLSELRGRRVLVLDSLRGSLAECWLEVLLGEQALGLPEEFFSRVTRPPKTALAVLPVFFRQGDACVVTRQGFSLMGELNPQVAKELLILASSPQIVPSLTCFGAGFDPALKERIIAAVTQVHATAAGKQLMAIFQCDCVEEIPLSRLQTTRQLLAANARLRRKAGGPESAQSSPPPSQPEGPGQ
jgi:phosphonate transport system substrate-binding protein